MSIPVGLSHATAVAELSEVFWSKVAKGEGCWTWTACRYTQGYGGFGIKYEGKWYLALAHRVAYLLTHETLPPSAAVCHSCDNPACVRPDHLWLGTRKDNAQDCLAKGRWAVIEGDQHGNARLTSAAVRVARQRHADGYGVTALAHEYGVSQPTMSDALRRVTWKSVY